MNKKHPIYKLKVNLLKIKPTLNLEFSRYIYKSYGVTLSREIFHINASDIVNGWLENQLETLTDEQELAFHSRVKIHEDDKEFYHLPMIDFVNTKSVDKILSKVSPISKMLTADIFLYESGNSFHGYYFELLREKEWYKFLGRILLCNPPSRLNDDIIDSRWVGHSLEHGFSALRWSKQTEKYKLIPTLSKNKQNEPSLFWND